MPAALPATPLWRRVAPWALAAALASALTVAWWAPWRKTAPSFVPLHLSMELGADIEMPGFQSNLALSPDGSTLAFMARKVGGTSAGVQLYLRRLDQLQSVPLRGTEGAVNPFFSPDGQWVAFFGSGWQALRGDHAGEGSGGAQEHASGHRAELLRRTPPPRPGGREMMIRRKTCKN
jgi:hypothetical protein